jgi:hypothetical protein
MGSRQKRRNDPCHYTTIEEWHFLMDKFTPHYATKVEKQLHAAATFLTAKLVHKEPGKCAKWKVWSKRHTEEDGSESDEGIHEEEDDDVEETIVAPVTIEGGRDDAREFQHFPPLESAEGLEVDEDDIQIPTFQWRYVREVTANFVDGKYELECSCGYLERTCVVCRHIFIVIWSMFGAWRLHEFRWHRITSKKFYYAAVVTDKCIDSEAGRAHCYPTFPATEVDDWLHRIDACDEGVPTEGRIECSLDQPEEQDGGHDDHQDGGGLDDEMSGPHPPKRLRANAASCDNKLMCIMTHLGAPVNNTVGYQALNSIIAEFIATTLHPTSLHELVKSSLGSVSHNQAGYNSYHRVLDDHLSGLTSRAPANPVGHPSTRRLKGWWERGKSSRPEHQSQLQRPELQSQLPRPSSQQPAQAHQLSQVSDAGQDTRPLSWRINFEGKTGESARAYLRRWGGEENWIVEVNPDTDYPGYQVGDRWFWKITNGLVQGSGKDAYITKGRWMKKNSVCTLDSGYPHAEPCEIQMVKAYGPSDCRLFTGVRGQRDQVTVQTKKVVGLRKQQEDACTNDIFCICSACSRLQ